MVQKWARDNFSEKDVRSIGRTGMGVRAMNLNNDDEVIGVGLLSEGRDILFVTEKGLETNGYKRI